MSEHEVARVKVGIVSCSGEEIPEGTISRLACRKVLDELRPGRTVTICLPLFIAAGQEERAFTAKFPTITVDGCAKRCAQRSTEALSGKPAASLVISEILCAEQCNPPVNRRNLTKHERMIVDVIAEKIAQTVDEVLS
ncbi:MAG: putative zinc-binding protein [Desulfuromonadaceae bacterium]|nr:putative zinc-binding protein [Desulfuromonadaceae bacterium]MDD5104419.1 putative zinc-binding protein [Desulfuromonadaceae bacterium]